MKITDLKELDKKRYRVYIDGEFAFVLYKGELKTYNIRVEHEVSDTSYKQIMEELLPKRAKLRAMNLLTARSYTESKLRAKLADGYYPDSIIDVAIDYVKKYGYIDDFQFAIDYITYHANDMNRKQMELKLLQRGISVDTIKKALSQVEDEAPINEMEQIYTLLRKKKYNRDTATEEEKCKLKCMLGRKGFQFDNILKALECFT